MLTVPQSEAQQRAETRQLLTGLQVPLAGGLVAHGITALVFASFGHWEVGLVIFLLVIGFEQALNRLFKHEAGLARSGRPDISTRVWVAIIARSLVTCLIYGTMIAIVPYPGAIVAMGLVVLTAAVFMIQLSLRPWLLAAALAPMLLVFCYGTVLIDDLLPLATKLLIGVSAVCTLTLLAASVSITARMSLHQGLKARERAGRQEELLTLLQDSEQMRQHLEAEAGIGFFQFDFAGNIEWSPGMYRAYGRSLSEPPATLEELASQIPEAFRDHCKQEFLQSLRSATPLAHAYPITGNDGSRRHVRVITIPVLGSDGRVTRVHGSVVDETQTTTMLHETQALERRLRATLSMGKCVVWEHDFVEGRTSGAGDVARFIGEEAAQGNDEIGKLERSVHPEDLTFVQSMVERAAKTGCEQLGAYRHLLADGQIIHVRTTLRASFRAGTEELAHLTGFTTDVTEDVHREAALASALDQANAASEAKSSFLANMSHELRTPLNSVVAMAGALAGTKLDGTQREMVEMIHQAGGTLTTIINDILDMARLERGDFQMNHQSFELPAVIEDATALFGLQARQKGLIFTVTSDLPDGLALDGDPTRVRQIVAALASNAVKFTDTGSVSVAASLDRDGSVLEPGGHASIKIAITDTGHGIPLDLVPTLFNAFEQADGSSTRRHGGAGMGLALSQALAGLIGGQIGVRSAPGVGSCFTLHLRLPVLQTAVEATSAASLPEQGVVRVLAADDHEANRQVLKLILEPLGVDLTMCSDGAEALEAFRLGRFDAVLMDLQMPVMDGLAATSAIRAIEVAEGRARTPIAAVTANAMDEHRQQAIDAGCDMHRAKPFTPAQIIETLEALLELPEAWGEQPAASGQKTA